VTLDKRVRQMNDSWAVIHNGDIIENVTYDGPNQVMQFMLRHSGFMCSICAYSFRARTGAIFGRGCSQ
jgi:hypothetical protein